MTGFTTIRIAGLLGMAGALAAAVPVLAGTAFAGTAFDGVYRGESVVKGGIEGVCGKNRPFTKRVTNGSFEYDWDPKEGGLLTVQIADDGTVSGTRTYGRGRQVTASGKVTGNMMEIEMTGKQCTRHLSLKKG